MKRIPESRVADRAVVVLTMVVVGAAVLAALYWGRALLIPLALALYLAFLLLPLVRAFQHWGLSPVPSVVAVTVVAAALLLAVGWAVGEECSRFANRLPDYADALDKKIQVWKAASHDNGFSRLSKVVQEIMGGSESPGEPAAGSPQAGKGSGQTAVVVTS